jgi:hypothetical protein
MLKDLWLHLSKVVVYRQSLPGLVICQKRRRMSKPQTFKLDFFHVNVVRPPPPTTTVIMVIVAILKLVHYSLCSGLNIREEAAVNECLHILQILIQVATKSAVTTSNCIHTICQFVGGAEKIRNLTIELLETIVTTVPEVGPRYGEMAQFDTHLYVSNKLHGNT